MKLVIAVMFFVVFSQNTLRAQTNAVDNSWDVFVQGDVEQLQAFYSDNVYLKPGSELLKYEWGLAEKGDRGTGKIVSRRDLMRGYSTLISELGREQWRFFWIHQ